MGAKGTDTSEELKKASQTGQFSRRKSAATTQITSTPDLAVIRTAALPRRERIHSAKGNLETETSVLTVSSAPALLRQSSSAISFSQGVEIKAKTSLEQFYEKFSDDEKILGNIKAIIGKVHHNVKTSNKKELFNTELNSKLTVFLTILADYEKDPKDPQLILDALIVMGELFIFYANSISSSDGKSIEDRIGGISARAERIFKMYRYSDHLDSIQRKFSDLLRTPPFSVGVLNEIGKIEIYLENLEHDLQQQKLQALKQCVSGLKALKNEVQWQEIISSLEREIKAHYSDKGRSDKFDAGIGECLNDALYCFEQLKEGLEKGDEGIHDAVDWLRYTVALRLSLMDTKDDATKRVIQDAKTAMQESLDIFSDYEKKPFLKAVQQRLFALLETQDLKLKDVEEFTEKLQELNCLAKKMEEPPLIDTIFNKINGYCSLLDAVNETIEWREIISDLKEKIKEQYENGRRIGRFKETLGPNLNRIVRSLEQLQHDFQQAKNNREDPSLAQPIATVLEKLLIASRSLDTNEDVKVTNESVQEQIKFSGIRNYAKKLTLVYKSIPWDKLISALETEIKASHAKEDRDVRIKQAVVQLEKLRNSLLNCTDINDADSQEDCPAVASVIGELLMFRNSLQTDPLNMQYVLESMQVELNKMVAFFRSNTNIAPHLGALFSKGIEETLLQLLVQPERQMSAGNVALLTTYLHNLLSAMQNRHSDSKSMLNILDAMKDILIFRAKLLGAEAMNDCNDIAAILFEAEKIAKNYRSYEFLTKIEKYLLSLLLDPTISVKGISADIASYLVSAEEELAEKVSQELTESLYRHAKSLNSSSGIDFVWDQLMDCLLADLKKRYTGFELGMQGRLLRDEHLNALAEGFSNRAQTPLAVLNAIKALLVFRRSLFTPETPEITAAFEQMNLALEKAIKQDVSFLADIEKSVLKVLAQAQFGVASIELCTVELNRLTAKANLYASLDENSRGRLQRLERKEGIEQQLVNLFIQEFSEWYSTQSKQILNIWGSDLIILLERALDKQDAIQAFISMVDVLELRKGGFNAYIGRDIALGALSEIKSFSEQLLKVHAVSPLENDILNEMTHKLLILTMSTPIEVGLINEQLKEMKAALLQHILNSDSVVRQSIKALHEELEQIEPKIIKAQKYISDESRKIEIVKTQEQIEKEELALSTLTGVYETEKRSQEVILHDLREKFTQKTSQNIAVYNKTMQKLEAEIDESQRSLPQLSSKISEQEHKNVENLETLKRNEERLSRLRTMTKSLEASKLAVVSAQEALDAQGSVVEGISNTIQQYKADLEQLDEKVALSTKDIYVGVPHLAKQLVDDIDQITTAHKYLGTSASSLLWYGRGEKAAVLSRQLAELRVALTELSLLALEPNVSEEKIQQLNELVDKLKEVIQSYIDDRTLGSAERRATLTRFLNRLKGLKDTSEELRKAKVKNFTSTDRLLSLNTHKQLVSNKPMERAQILRYISPQEVEEAKALENFARLSQVASSCQAEADAHVATICESQNIAQKMTLDEVVDLFKKEELALEEKNRLIKENDLPLLTQLQEQRKVTQERLDAASKSKEALSAEFQEMDSAIKQEMKGNITSTELCLRTLDSDFKRDSQAHIAERQALITRRDELCATEASVLNEKKELEERKKQIHEESSQKQESLKTFADVEENIGVGALKKRLQEEEDASKKQILESTIERVTSEISEIEQKIMAERKLLAVLPEGLVTQYADKRLELAGLKLAHQNLCPSPNMHEASPRISTHKKSSKEVHIAPADKTSGSVAEQQARRDKEAEKSFRENSQKTIKALDAKINETINDLIKESNLCKYEMNYQRSSLLDNVRSMLECKFKMKEAMMTKVRSSKPKRTKSPSEPVVPAIQCSLNPPVSRNRFSMLGLGMALGCAPIDNSGAVSGLMSTHSSEIKNCQ